MCNGERVRKLCTVTHRGTTNVIVPGVTNTICGTCQCIINFFLFFNLSHSISLSLSVCLSLSLSLYKYVWVYTLSQNTFQPHGPRIIAPEVYSIIIFSTQTVQSSSSYYTSRPICRGVTLSPRGPLRLLASFAVLFYRCAKKKILWDTIRASWSKTNTRRKNNNNNNNNNNNRDARIPQYNIFIIVAIVCRATRRQRFPRDPVCHGFRTHVYLL